MEKSRCTDCAYYLRHYTFDGRKIFRVNCGHCKISRPQVRKPDAKTCENFTPGPSQEYAFATKEYLSKELLQYLLNLELLPKIEDSRG